MLTTSGQSQFEMIRRLSGNGRLSVVDGEARGFDLGALSRGLKRANLRNLVALGKAGFASIGLQNDQIFIAYGNNTDN